MGYKHEECVLYMAVSTPIEGVKDSVLSNCCAKIHNVTLC